ncbi:hypothetical protein GCM10023186_01240 [Hymenobacter koreensis]|uniref:Secretion system C-terminal sorting domain-containing protein n=2 Tax=Hymenobacter koreensis TaxID=1084523 RepID=A0ABP8ITD0_9BACT
MSTARAQQGAVAHPNGNIYVFGGYNGSTTFNSTEAYNIATGIWTSRAPMPVPMQGPAAAVGLDGNIYSFAGRDQSIYRSECFRYNPTTNTWTTIASMPSARWEARALTAPSGLIYVFGGWNFDLGITPATDVQIYNPSTNTWSVGTSMPRAIMGMAAAIDAAGLMHIYGGIGASPYPALTDHYVYNPTTNAWTTAASLPNPARGYTTGVAGSDGNLYIVGGDNDIGMNLGTFYNNVDYYTPATNTWTAGTSLPQAITEMRAVAAGNFVYVVGGLTASNSPTATLYRTATTTAVATTTTWTGNVSTDWFTAGNWSDGVPTALLDASIPSGRPRMPIIASGAAAAKALTISSGAALSMSGGTLDLKGNVANDGSFSASTGTVTLSGAANQTLNGTGTSNLYDLTVGLSGATLGGPLRVARVLTLNGNLNSAGNLTLLSTPALSGMIVNSVGQQVQGNMTIQRAEAGSMQGYRHLSAPVTGATVAQLGSGGSSVVVNPAYNTSATPGLVTPFPTVFAYDQTRLNSTTDFFDRGWVSPTGTTQAMSTGQGYTAQLAGGQTLSFTGSAPPAEQVQLSGLGNSGAANSGWHLLGNPFPSPLSLSAMRPALQTGGLADAVYVFRPSGPYTGSYDQYVNGIGTGDLSNGQLALGQGFFVRNPNAGTNASLSITRAMRLTTYANPTFQRQANTDTRPRLDLQVSNGSAYDVVVFYAEAGATPGVDVRFDAWKVPTASLVSVATVAGTEQLSIQGLPELTAPQVVLPLEVVAPAGTFTFSAQRLMHFPATAEVLLEDRLTGTLHDLRRGAYTATLAGGTTSGRFFVRLGAARVLASNTHKSLGQVQLYPNPAQGKAFLNVPATGVARIVVLNTVGQQVLSQEARAVNGLVTAELNTSSLGSGVYSVRVTTAGGSATSKLVVR